MSDFQDRGTGVKDPRGTASRAGARPAGGDAGGGDQSSDGGRRTWLPPLLALLVIGVILAFVIVGRDDDQAATEAPGGTSTQADGEIGTRGAEAGAVGGGAATGDGTLTARSVSLLPPPDGGLGEYVGEPVTGAGVPIQSVIEGDTGAAGFFVGTSAQERVFVQMSGATGADIEPRDGQTVNVQGAVRAAPEDAAGELGLSAPDAQTVEDQGGYVAADSVTMAE
jgi:hypothetical protein